MIRIENNLGSISITNEVFCNIAGEAATRCFGVKGMAGRSKGDGLVMLLRRESMSKGVAVIFVGEDIDVLIELCDRILVINGGQITGIVDARVTSREEVGLLMTKTVMQEELAQ